MAPPSNKFAARCNFISGEAFAKICLPGENFKSVVKIIMKLIKSEKLFIMDKETMVPFTAAGIIGFKTDNDEDALLIANNR